MGNGYSRLYKWRSVTGVEDRVRIKYSSSLVCPPGVIRVYVEEVECRLYAYIIKVNYDR
jgi:hypothetical protein